VSLDVSPDLRRRLRMAAARRDTTMSRYVLDAVQEQLRRDLGAQDLLALTARADPVLGGAVGQPQGLRIRTIKRKMIERRLGALA
jgi:uncharacterized protein (DUF1778 family)